MLRQRFITIKNVTELKKKFQSLIRFHSVNKIKNYNVVGGGKEKKKRKKCPIQKNLLNKSKHKNNKCFA